MPKPLILITLAMLWLVCHFVVAQPKSNRFRQANKLYKRGEYTKAILLFNQVTQEKPKDAKAHLMLGLAYLASTPKHEALTHFEKAYQLNPKVNKNLHFYLASSYQVNFKFKEAIDHYNVYKKKAKSMRSLCDHKIDECHRAEAFLNQESNYIVEILPAPINSMYDDYAPLFNLAEDELIFTSARDSALQDVKTNILYEEVFVSKKEAGQWIVPKPLSGNINKQNHDAASFVSHDGKMLVLYYPDGNGDLYKSFFDGNDWSQPNNMGQFINDPLSSETSGCFTPDGKKFYFASDRPDGFGGLDLYVAEINQFGEWGNAENLGPNVNTAGDEDAPFIVNDSLLYFSSNGHPGLGNYDIFKVERIKKKWQKPVNLGYPINTPEYENFFHLAADGKHGYFSSVRKEGLGRTDICKFTVQEIPMKREEYETLPEDPGQLKKTEQVPPKEN
jgi:hypothetical protein